MGLCRQVHYFRIPVHGELLICPEFHEFSVSCYDAEMRDLVILFVHLLTTVARLASPGGVRSVVAESVLVKHQLLILNRSRQRAPNLPLSDRIVAGCCALFMRASSTRGGPANGGLSRMCE